QEKIKKSVTYVLSDILGLEIIVQLHYSKNMIDNKNPESPKVNFIDVMFFQFFFKYSRVILQIFFGSVNSCMNFFNNKIIFYKGEHSIFFKIFPQGFFNP